MRRFPRWTSIQVAVAMAVALALDMSVPAAGQPAKMKVLLDTDSGTDIDDAWALG